MTSVRRPLGARSRRPILARLAFSRDAAEGGYSAFALCAVRSGVGFISSARGDFASWVQWGGLAEGTELAKGDALYPRYTEG